jgi:hypothetical protein
VSDGTNEALRRMTQNAITSVASDDVNIVVLERSGTVKYAHADTFLQRLPFNYNQCLNDGAGMGNADYICFTNNDVLFPQDFTKQAIDIMSEYEYDVLSVKNQNGFIHPEVISGFCFVMRRSAWNKIGELNTNYKFWCADNVTSEQIKQHGLKGCRSNIKVTHFTSSSLKHLGDSTRTDYTSNCVKQFNRDFNQNVLNMGFE